MRTPRLGLMIMVSCVVAAGSRAIADDQAPKSQELQTPTKADELDKQVPQSKDLKELEKRPSEELLAQCKENDRLYKQMVS